MLVKSFYFVLAFMVVQTFFSCTTFRNRSGVQSNTSDQNQWSCQTTGNYWANDQCFVVSRHTKFLACEAGSGFWNENEQACKCDYERVFDWQRRACVPNQYLSMQKDFDKWQKFYSEKDHCIYSNGEWYAEQCLCPQGTVWQADVLNCMSTIGFNFDCPGKFVQDYCYDKKGENLVYNPFFGWVSSDVFLQNPNMGLIQNASNSLLPQAMP